MGHRQKEPIVITAEGGLSFRATVRSHELVLDQPIEAGGEDAGPMPIEMLGVSLGSCVALYVRQYMASRDLDYTGMRVEVEQHGAANPGRIGRFVAKVFLPVELPEEHMQLLERVARSCPAHNTLAHGAEVDIALLSPMAVSP